VKHTFKTIEGTYDILPDAENKNPMLRAEAWQQIETTLRDVMQRFAFEEIRTPILEPTELIARGIGQLTDIVSKEIFSFQRGKTNYVLRPEMTAPVMRAYLQHHLAQRGGEQRLYYIGPCFRAERPQKGRFRQFHQFGAEIIGSADARADAEIISLLINIYREYRITNTTLRINTLGDKESRPRYRQALQAYLEPYKNDLSAISRERLETNPLRILDTKLENERRLLHDAPHILDFIDTTSREHYEEVLSYLDDLHITYVEDPFLVRGLDYYTRTAFELESPDIGAQSALAGGGRYDLLAQEIGSPTKIAGVGFAAGIERLFLALETQHIPLPVTPPLDIFVVTRGEVATQRMLPYVQVLRQAGLRVSFDLSRRSIKAQMRTANRRRARYVIIVTTIEFLQRYAQVKNMETGEQVPVPLDDLAYYNF